MNTDDVELHDAVIRSINVDMTHRVVGIALDAYVSPEDESRAPILIRFSDVRSFSSTIDLISLADNERSGNVNYWKVAVQAGKSFLYLNEGCVLIEAEQTTVEVLKGIG